MGKHPFCCKINKPHTKHIIKKQSLCRFYMHQMVQSKQYYTIHNKEFATDTSFSQFSSVFSTPLYLHNLEHFKTINLNANILLRKYYFYTGQHTFSWKLIRRIQSTLSKSNHCLDSICTKCFNHDKYYTIHNKKLPTNTSFEQYDRLARRFSSILNKTLSSSSILCLKYVLVGGWLLLYKT